MRFIYPVLLATGVVALLAGCGQQNDPVIAEHPGGEPVLGRGLFGQPATVSPTITTSTVLSGYLLAFDGRYYDGSQTTFSYTVSGAGAVQDLSHFFIEVPDCAPVVASTDPSEVTINLNPLSEIYGATWNILLGPTESRSYSLTYPGDVPLGVHRAHVKAGTTLEVGEIAGACNGYEISGTVYVDADTSGVQDAEESGIANVTVTLVDGDGNVQKSTTDENGDYAFLKIAGTYTVRIDAATPESDFNEGLAESFDPTTPTSLVVNVGPDALNQDFGYNPQTQEIIFELETGILLTSGEPDKYWKAQLRWLASGHTSKLDFSVEEFNQFFLDIQGLYLPVPFQFTPGNEVSEALDILSGNPNDPLEKLIQQLLTAEFNEVSGKGLLGEPELQEALLKWVESIVVDRQGSESPAAVSRWIGEPQGPSTGTTRNDDDGVKSATDMLLLLNGSTGGGSGGGG